ncbi:hypothetical protein DC1_00040 [Burkholderia phage DC1]|uniref:Uncharacterized protein n=1 Tax=Burkholderia phage DC1 TaxID=2881398 RepID=I6NW26_9CAUD|nr:hypothetical protein B862_gp43 [Burkholderia phage DC1]AEZ50858.1 hypothetical protein DC1_00040 [Burkholderia phage DC1]
MPEDGRAVPDQVLVEPDAVRRARKQPLQAVLALLQLDAAQVRAIQFHQVERVQERLAVVPARAQQLEHGQPVAIAADDLAIEDERPGAQRGGAREDLWIPLRPVVPVARQQPHALGIAGDLKAEPIVLELVQPVGPGRRCAGGFRLAGDNEARSTPGGTLEHASEIVTRTR